MLMRIAVIGALPSSLINFRGPLLKAIVEQGHEVVTAANGRDPCTEVKLRMLGVEYCPIRIARTGMNPLADIAALFDILRLTLRVRPDVVLSYTIKPVIYGALAARLCGVRRVLTMIEGLGRAFMPCESFTHFVSSIAAKGLYRIALRCSDRIFFLNPDDLNQFLEQGYVTKQQAVLLDGIGVDLAYYSRAEMEISDSTCLRFLMIARLLRDKGVREYVEAAKMVKARRQYAEFLLAGAMDENPSSINQEELASWLREGLVNYVGYLQEVRPLFRNCHVYVLPSYREGTPRTVLEALATARAVITTDAPGCRETVSLPVNLSFGRAEGGSWNLKIGRNGILVPVKDARSLAEAMEYFFKHPKQITVMGNESRAYAEHRYDVNKVNALILDQMGIM